MKAGGGQYTFIPLFDLLLKVRRFLNFTFFVMTTSQYICCIHEQSQNTEGFRSHTVGKIIIVGLQASFPTMHRLFATQHRSERNVGGKQGRPDALRRDRPRALGRAACPAGAQAWTNASPRICLVFRLSDARLNRDCVVNEIQIDIMGGFISYTDR